MITDLSYVDVIVYGSIAIVFMMVVAGITIFTVLTIQKLARKEAMFPPMDDYELILNLPEPDETEQKILELHAQGLPKTRIAMEVFGNKGGSQNKKVEDVITRYGGN